MTVTMAGSPYRYHLSSGRPNMVLPNEKGVVDNWEIGNNRFPFAAQNRYFNFDAFRYPDAFHARHVWGGTPLKRRECGGRSLSLAKEFKVTERVKFTLRWDANNVTKEPQFAAPNSAYNLNNTHQLRDLQRDARKLLGCRHRADAPDHRWALPVLSAYSIARNSMHTGEPTLTVWPVGVRRPVAASRLKMTTELES